MAGLLGVGKSALSKRLSDVSGATNLEIDSVEQALRDLTGIDVESEGIFLPTASLPTIWRCDIRWSLTPVIPSRDPR